jgi:hypothetical protein
MGWDIQLLVDQVKMLFAKETKANLYFLYMIPIVQAYADNRVVVDWHRC